MPDPRARLGNLRSPCTSPLDERHFVPGPDESQLIFLACWTWHWRQLDPRLHRLPLVPIPRLRYAVTLIFQGEGGIFGLLLDRSCPGAFEGGAEAATDSDRVRLRVEREEEATLEEVDAAGLVVFCLFFGGIVKGQTKETTEVTVVA